MIENNHIMNYLDFFELGITKLLGYFKLKVKPNSNLCKTFNSVNSRRENWDSFQMQNINKSDPKEVYNHESEGWVQPQPNKSISNLALGSQNNIPTSQKQIDRENNNNLSMGSQKNNSGGNNNPVSEIEINEEIDEENTHKSYL